MARHPATGSAPLLDRACAQAMVDGIHSYRYVKKLTEKIVADALAAIDRAEEARQMEFKLQASPRAPADPVSRQRGHLTGSRTSTCGE